MLDHCRQVGKWHLLLGIRNTCAPRALRIVVVNGEQ